MSTLVCSVCCEESGVYECIFWEILQKLGELHRTEDLLLKTKESILQTGCTCEDGQLKTEDNRKLGV